MTSDLVLVETRARALVVTINRPQARNAINRRASEAIAEALDRLDADASLSVGVLTGAGGHFCSGMDLKAFLAGERVELEGRGLAGLVERPPNKPLIAAVEGYALAGGCEIALACDLIVAAQDAQFGLPEVRRGLIAGSGGLLRLPRRIPRNIAMEYALTGRMMSARDARGFGLVNQLVAPGTALDGALALAHEIAANGPLAVAMTKQVIDASSDWPADEIWTRQKEILERVIVSDDAREGARAFAEKRAPNWTGN
ncbi:MAG: crotonase/enoyl-CoA hydratase family protein [Pseudomonadota bacterium]|nr:crotonase/enoyl-CoA hydratase family protein [Pseudomonadota bacterium]